MEHSANTLIFVLAGATVAFDVLALHPGDLGPRDAALLAANYLALVAIRATMLLLAGPYLRLFGYRLTPADCSFPDFLRRACRHSPHTTSTTRPPHRRRARPPSSQHATAACKTES
jgi:hypothetical protein